MVAATEQERNSPRQAGGKSLAARGIADAAHSMGWHTRGAYWCYPVPAWPPGNGAVAGVLRGKLMPGAEGHKYTWFKPQGAPIPPFYFPPGLVKAVREDAGLLHVVNGEPAVLAMMEAGLRNVLSCYGEGHAPPDLPEKLAEIGVKRVVVWPDSDTTGNKAALKFALAAKCEAIIARPVTWMWPGLGSGADLNDMWAAYTTCLGPRPGALERAVAGFLSDLEYLAVSGERPAQPKPHVSKVTGRPRKHRQDARLTTDWRGRDEEAAARAGWREGKRFPCPAARHDNDEHEPAAMLLRGNDGRLRVFCHKCDESWSAYDAATLRA